MTPRAPFPEPPWQSPAARLDWQGWGEDTAIAVWSRLGPVEIQPIHALRDATLLGAEARGGHGWTQATRHRLTTLLLHMACDEARLWRDLPGLAPLTVVARLPAVACTARLVDQVAGALAATGLDASRLELGLCLDADAPAGPGELLAWSALRDMGLGLALELAPNVATHPSSLGRLPFTSLRLPPCVADQVEDRSAMRRLVREAVRTAGAHAGYVLASGVRSAAQRDIFSELGCEAAQGRLFGAPMHPATFHCALEGDAFL